MQRKFSSMKLHFSIKKNKLIRQDDEIITSFSKNVNKCYFECEKPLEDVYKYALFISSTNEQQIVDLGFGLNVSCIIPEETLKTNYFSVSVFGGERFTTTQEKIIIQRSGFNEDSIRILESDNINESDTNDIEDEEDHRRFYDRDYLYRHNRFEIQEHPYS